MKIFFIGSVEFSLLALKKIIGLDVEVVGACIKQASPFNSDFADLTPLCKENNIPYQYVENINSADTLTWIKSLKPDIICCFGWSYLIKQELLNIPSIGVIGFHPTALPQNRGRHPVIWALALGLEKTASTFFFMDKGADSGDILSQEAITIDPQDDARDLYDKITEMGLLQIEKFIPTLNDSSYKRIVQDSSQANTWRKRGQKDGVIDFRLSSQSIYNLIRALTKPYVGAHLVYKDKNIIIWKSEIIVYQNKNIEAGKVLNIEGNTITIKTGDSAIRFLKHNFTTLPKKGEYL
ncbi:MAG: formyl transferase [Rhizobiales bacterium]|nr:formyl transferase [Hyphomicrobiales bacterium]